MGSKTPFALPPEIAAQQKQRRSRTLRLYVIGIGAVVVLCLAALFVYGTFLSNGISADQRFATDLTAAHTAYVQGRLLVANRALDDALTYKDGYNLRFDKGLVLLKAGRYDDAIAQLRRAEALNTTAPTAYLYAGVAGLAGHHFASARDDARRGLALVPQDPDLNGLLASAEQALGHTKPSAQALNTARANGYKGQTIAGWIGLASFEYDQATGGS